MKKDTKSKKKISPKCCNNSGLYFIICYLFCCYFPYENLKKKCKTNK